MKDETPDSKTRRSSLIKAAENIKSISKPKKKARDDVYEVEDIISHVVVDGLPIYSVTWVGYPGEITEMTEDELQNCGELLASYKEKLKEAGDTSLLYLSSSGLPSDENRNDDAGPSRSASQQPPTPTPSLRSRCRRTKRTIAPDAELGYLNGCVVDAYKGFSTKYDEPVVLVSYKEPLPSGFENKQDEIVPVRVIAKADPQSAMDWSWNYSALPDASQIKWSESRDVVEVPGGAEWKIRKLEEEYPEYCWKYCGTFPLAQYHFKMASGDNCRDVPRLPMFYATIPHHVSPFELSIQPKFLEKARRSLLLQMAEEYDQNITQNFTDSQMFTPVACACYVNSKWCRGRINKLCGNSCVLVELVDYGTEVFVNPSELRPLLRKFGRMPPLALKCRLKDVYINDLNTSKVEEFHRIIEDCKGVVRVELLTASEPFLINIFHPTLEDENLGQMFYRAAENEGHEQAKQRRWADHLRRENCEDDECFEISEE
ncbi:hypothetical protein Q1695_006739 [Nippostrongylus brasiliensis]|nr:hypothetical protein Q1695_006739 [Nippostrongylus brasiliensis]